MIICSVTQPGCRRAEKSPPRDETIGKTKHKQFLNNKNKNEREKGKQSLLSPLCCRPQFGNASLRQ
jgi:hypothetical protein